MDDLKQQVLFVSNAVERILSQIDMDPLSPSYGCVHPAYWRDKTSELADMRRQEIAFPLALLYRNEYPGSPHRDNPRLVEGVEAILRFWCRNQYPDGSLDEWYKGERAFAAAAFSLHAISRTALTLSEVLHPDLFDLVRNHIHRTAVWLANRDDIFKANHQAVGVAALAWAAHLLKDQRLHSAAINKLRILKETQTREGWFPEIGRMDIGYTFLTVEYTSMAMDLWGDWSEVGAFRKAFDYACEWVHPDLSVGEEYGICHNVYVSRIAAILLSPFSGRAAWMRSRFNDESSEGTSVSSLLSDDLRLMRWAFQPLLAYDYDHKTPEAVRDPEPIPLSRKDACELVSRDTSLVRFSTSDGTGIFAGAAGGILRLFDPATGLSLTDYGYALTAPEGYLTNLTFNPSQVIESIDDGWEISTILGRVKKFMPSFAARFLLRIASSTATGSRLTRTFIDRIRKKKGTSINQASANLRNRSSSYRLLRRIRCTQGGLHVEDRIEGEGLQKKNLFILHSTDHNRVRKVPLGDQVMTLPEHFRLLLVHKEFCFKDGWSQESISAEAVP